MTNNIYLLTIFIASALGWASWIVVINKLSPFVTSYLALILFYASLFIALAGTFTLLNYYLRVWLNRDEEFSHHLNIAMRQGILLSTMLSVGLGFQRLKILTWWDALLLLAIVLLVEFYFMEDE